MSWMHVHVYACWLCDGLFFGVLFSLLWVFTFFVLVFGFDASQRGVLQVLGWVDSTAWAARSRHKARTRVTAYVTLCNYTWIHTAQAN